MPVWFQTSSASHINVYGGSGAGSTYPASGDVIPDTFYGSYVQQEGVRKEDMEQYLASIEHLCESVRKEDGQPDTWTAVMADYKIRFTLEDQTLLLFFEGQDFTFAPAWYLEAAGQ